MASDSSVHGIGMEKKNPPFRGTPSANEDRLSSSKIFKCRNCGIRHGVRECPAYGKTCHNCKKTASFQEHVPVSEKRPWASGRGRKRRVYDCESLLFVGSVTSEVQIQNDECYVTLSVQEQPHAT